MTKADEWSALKKEIAKAQRERGPRSRFDDRLRARVVAAVQERIEAGESLTSLRRAARCDPTPRDRDPTRIHVPALTLFVEPCDRLAHRLLERCAQGQPRCDRGGQRTTSPARIGTGHACSSSRYTPSRDWIKALHGQIAHEIPEGWRLCGENLYARHSIAYDALPSYFTLFSIWDAVRGAALRPLGDARDPAGAEVMKLPDDPRTLHLDLRTGSSRHAPY